MKIIFLDFDGVLVTHQSWHSRKWQHADADLRAVEALNWLIAQTGAKIVVSSTWRRGTKLIELREVVNGHFGVIGDVIDKTPVLTTIKQFEGLPGMIEVSAERGDEIDYWLRSDHLPLQRRGREPIESYVILDDDDDLGIHISRLVRTEFEHGLTMEHAKRAAQMLR
jgi:hypothetical protein